MEPLPLDPLPLVVPSLWPPDADAPDDTLPSELASPDEPPSTLQSPSPERPNSSLTRGPNGLLASELRFQPPDEALDLWGHTKHEGRVQVVTIRLMTLPRHHRPTPLDREAPETRTAPAPQIPTKQHTAHVAAARLDDAVEKRPLPVSSSDDREMWIA